MRKRLLFFHAVSVTIPLLAVAESAQGQVGVSAQKLKPLEWVAGSWRREWTAKKGEKQAKEWRFAWTPNKNAIVITQISQRKAKTVGQLDALFGWDKATGAIVGAGIGTSGAFGGDWTITTKAGSFTITVGSSNWVFSKKGKDTLVVTPPRGTVREFRKIVKRKSRKG